MAIQHLLVPTERTQLVGKEAIPVISISRVLIICNTEMTIMLMEIGNKFRLERAALIGSKLSCGLRLIVVF